MPSGIIKKEAPLDTSADFWCEFCEETRKMVVGEGGRILDLFYSNRLDQIDHQEFLAIDRRVLNKQAASEPMLG